MEGTGGTVMVTEPGGVSSFCRVESGIQSKCRNSQARFLTFQGCLDYKVNGNIKTARETK
jgi:hypothetical protein